MKFLVLSFLNLFDFFYKKKLLAKLKEFMGLDIDIFFDVGSHKGETINLILKHFNVNKTYAFEFDEKKEILKSIDNHPKHVHGIYSVLDLKKVEKLKLGIYQHGWFTGFEGRFIKHDFLFRHFITFDPYKDNYVLINKIGYFFKKDNDDDFLPYEDEGAYIWMDYIK